MRARTAREGQLLDVLSGASDELAIDELGDELLGDGVLNRVVILGLAGGDN